eukprot:754171-Hanusia_phi.AAC.6
MVTRWQWMSRTCTQGGYRRLRCWSVFHEGGVGEEGGTERWGGKGEGVIVRCNEGGEEGQSGEGEQRRRVA